MKVISMYLPQYHRVKENDEWWGDGFTDWVSTREAEPLFPEHYQPHVPQNNYYYDLTQKESLEYQAKLMKKYGVDGQCIYHYWFKDGRQILEKPAECLLEWKDIDMPFCFSWANQTWARSWANIQNANAWCDSKEVKEKDSTEKSILLEQNYGDESDWQEHFEYLVKFFRDERYIKYNNKPVFMFYQTGEVPVLSEMKDFWNKLARQEGFDGIYFIGANDINNILDSNFSPAPQYGLDLSSSVYLENGLRTEEYEQVYDRLLSYALSNKGNTGAFVGYDDTPRRGLKGCVVKNGSPKLFKKYLTKILAINYVNNQEFTFINAWNEWGEGMHLEPDEKYGEQYLQAVLEAKKDYSKVAEGIELIKNSQSLISEYNFNDDGKCRRYESYWKCFRKWIENYQEGKTISKILVDRGVNKIAIYGLGMMGKMLVNDLKKGCEIEIAFGIDQKERTQEFDFSTYLPTEAPKFDGTVVVAVSYDFNTIREELLAAGYDNVISIYSLLSGE